MSKKNHRFSSHPPAGEAGINTDKSKQNQKILILSVSFLLLAGLIIIFTRPAKIKSYPYEPANIEIVVGKNVDGEQMPNAGVQTDVLKNLGAATVNDITGGTGNPADQAQGIEEMLKDKNIDVQK